MTIVTIYHNPRCSKSRQTLQLLNDNIAENNNYEIEIVEYLKQPPSHQQIGDILSMLQFSPRQLMRTKETLYSEQKLANLELTDSELIDAMVASPKLIERPIVVANGKAAIGRPPEQVLEIL